MIKQPILYIFLLLIPFISFFSCKKIIDTGFPANQLVTSSVFADSANANAAVLGIYAELMSNSTLLSAGNGAITAFAGMSADELFPSSATNTNDLEFYQNGLTAENGSVHTVWSQLYKIIYQTNACIDGINNSNALSSSLKELLIAECKAIRCFLHFNLVNLFGSVPYVTGIDYSLNAKLSQISQEEILRLLSLELMAIRNQLSPGYSTSEKTRFTQMAAIAFLARINLYQSDWSGAEQNSSTVIASNQYLLETSINSVFLSGSKESIFQLRPVQTGFNTAEGQVFNPTSSSSVRPRYALQPSLLSAFQMGDIRRTINNWVKSKVVAGQTFFYPYKYKLRADNNANNPAEHYVVLRLAEQYLIRAEARAHQNKIAEGLADLNIIRQRAGLPSATASTAVVLLALIEQERRVELFAEWGHRWFDLKRTNRVEPLLSISKSPGWQVTDALYPIPFTELQRNPFLIQNPGY